MIKKICKHCKNPFMSRPDRGIFCSVNCRANFDSTTNSKMVSCGICKKEFKSILHPLRKYCSQKCLGIANRERSKFGNVWNWKGSQVSYGALHMWVRKWKGTPDTCEHCEKSGLNGRAIQWANKSKKYLRDLDDWIRLCVKCHKIFDKKS